MKKLKEERTEDSIIITYKYNFFLHIYFWYMSSFPWFLDTVICSFSKDKNKIDGLIYKFDKTNINEKKEFIFKSIDIFLFGVLKKEYNYQMIYSFCIKDFIDIHKVKNVINLILSEELPKINSEFEIIHENISNQFSISEKPEKIEEV